MNETTQSAIDNLLIFKEEVDDGKFYKNKFYTVFERKDGWCLVYEEVDEKTYEFTGMKYSSLEECQQALNNINKKGE